MAPKPSPSKVKFRIDGPVPAAAEILASDRLSDFSGTLIDPNSSKGTVSAIVNLGMPVKGALTKADTTYTVTADLGGFAADKLVMNQKLEANTLKIVANNAGYQVKGDVKINGQQASLDYRKPAEGDADIKLQATLDDASRARLGLDLGPARQRRDSGQAVGKIGERRSRQPPRHRGRSHLAEARQHPAGLGQAARQVGQGHLQRGAEAAIDPLRGYRGRWRRRLDQGIAGSRPERRSHECELPDLFAVGRRQDLAEGRARPRRRGEGRRCAATCSTAAASSNRRSPARRPTPRARPRTSISTSTSSSARSRASMARRCAASTAKISRRNGVDQELHAERQGRTRHARDRRFARPRARAGAR